MALAALEPEIASVLAALEANAPLISKLATGALASVGAASLIKGLAVAKTSGTPTQKAAAARIPRFALVDLHNDHVVVTMGNRRAYRFLIRPRSRGARTKIVHERVIERDAR